MDVITSVVLAVHIIVSALIIITVLLQPGKSGDLGSIFGGSTQSIFGATGAVPFLTKLTRVFALIFLITSLSLGYISTQKFKSSVIRQGGEIAPPPAVEERAQEGDARGGLGDTAGESLQPGEAAVQEPADGESTAESGMGDAQPGEDGRSINPAEGDSGTQ